MTPSQASALRDALVRGPLRRVPGGYRAMSGARIYREPGIDRLRVERLVASKHIGPERVLELTPAGIALARTVSAGQARNVNWRGPA